MREQLNKPKEIKNISVANSIAKKKREIQQGIRFVDNRGKTVIQRVINGYKPGKLRSNYKVMKDLNSEQMKSVQQMHEDLDRTYALNEARQLVGAQPIDDVRTGHSAPFPWRYSGTDDYMDTNTNNSGGFVQYPSSGLPEHLGEYQQTSLVSGSAYQDLQQGSKRAITQTSVMGNISPNVAAQTLCLPEGAWEWLHLVAFSIKQTHIDSLSVQSMNLIKRTNQPQQIRENLVLGSAGANTAMLTYESLIKSFMRKRPAWALDLYVNADVDVVYLPVKGLSIPVAKRIDYHFQFRTDKGEVTPPVILAFNPMDIMAPSLSEYGRVTEMLRKFLTDYPITTPDGFKGLNTHGFLEL